MTKRFRLRQLISALLLSGLSLICCVSVSAQQTPNGASDDRDRGIQLYKQGDSEGASAVLRAAVKRRKDDLTAWYYLGLALEQTGDTGAARKAFEQATKLGEHTLEKQLDQASTSKEVSTALLSIRSDLLKATVSAEKYIALDSTLSGSKREEWTRRVELLRGFADAAANPEGLKIFSGKEVTTKARVLNWPASIYSDEAKRNKVTGTVVLRCVFAASGRVTLCRVKGGLPDGLNESAITAARQIRFIPATLDGKPVSMWMELHYHFDLY